jgi:hypothetical protein
MNAGLLLLAIASSALIAGCEYAFSDVATRVRYALVEENIKLQLSTSESATIAIDPDHWPDGCEQGAGYRLVLSPYQGGKQVAVGNIDVYCKNGQRYYTGLGSEQIYVTREMAVEKKSGEEVRITMRKTSAGTEIVALQ